MNEIVNNFSLTEDKFMPEMYLEKPCFKYSACVPFIKNKEIMQNFNGTEDSRYIYQEELDKAFFQHDMTYGDFKDLTQRPASNKILCITVFNIDKNPKHDGYQRGIFSMVYKVFDKKSIW